MPITKFLGLKILLLSVFVIIIIFLIPLITTKAADDFTPVPKGVNWGLFLKWKKADGSYNFQGIESDLADMQNGDITYARIHFDQSIPNSFYDQLIPLMKSYGVKPLALIQGIPVKDIGTETQRQAYRDWLAGEVTRYGADIRMWEAWNEPNGPGYWNIDTSDNSDPVLYQQSVQNYIYRLQDTYSTIKAVDPTALVMSAGFAEWVMERYMDVFIQLGGYHYMDAVAFHPYRPYPDEVLGRLLSFKNKMNQVPEFAAKPIWITEIGYHAEPSGWNSGMNAHDQNTRAEYLRQTMQKLKDNGVEVPIFWYTFDEPGSTTKGFGLIVKDNTTLATTYLPVYNFYKDFWRNIWLTIIYPIEDAYVNSSSPNTNYGSDMRLYSLGSPAKTDYLKFDLTPHLGKNILEGKFKFHTTYDDTSSSSSTFNVSEVADNSWSENTLNYNNKPALSATTSASLAGVKKWEEYNLSLSANLIQPRLGGLFSLGVASGGTDDAIFFSKDAANWPRYLPQLLIYYSSPTFSPTPIPTSTPNPTPASVINLVTNPGCETNASSWNGFQSTISRITSDFYTGIASCKAAWSNTGNYFSMTTTYNLVNSGVAGDRYMGRAFVKAGNSSSVGKTVQLILRQKGANKSNANTNSVAVTLSTLWQKIPDVTTAIDTTGRSLDAYLIQNSASSNNAIFADEISVVKQ